MSKSKESTNAGTYNTDIEENIKGFKLRTVNILILVLEAALALVLLITGGVAAGHYSSLIDSTDDYKATLDTVYDLEQVSNYLTEQCKQFAVVEQTQYMEGYFEVLSDHTNRKTVVANFKRQYGSVDRQICSVLNDAVEEAFELTDADIHSMKLIASCLELDEDTLPADVAEYELSAEESAYSSQQKKDLAYDLVFGDEYYNKKSEVMDGYAQVRSWVESYANQRQNESVAGMNSALLFQRIMVIVLVLVMGAMFVFILLMIVNPLQAIIKQLQEEAVVETKGFYEMKYLASTYNDICRINAASKLELNQQANYDALTGIYNRGSFNRLCDFFRASLHPLVFLLIDVDVFKSINDNYGHEVGDRALKKVAKVLKDSIREEDYAIRYGGDEFAALLIGLKPSEKKAIGEKIDHMNNILMHPEEEGMPSFSLSVGIAFSPKGYSEELFHKADKAVYYTKSHGRCGYTFYQENMIKVDSKVN